MYAKVIEEMKHVGMDHEMTEELDVNETIEDGYGVKGQNALGNTPLSQNQNDSSNVHIHGPIPGVYIGSQQLAEASKIDLDEDQRIQKK